MWKKMMNRQFLVLDFDRQKIIGNFIVDFYCIIRKTVIELDGVSHDFKGEYDSARNDFLASLGLKVIHIQAKDVLSNVDDVIRNLEMTFGQNVPPPH